MENRITADTYITQKNILLKEWDEFQNKAQHLWLVCEREKQLERQRRASQVIGALQGFSRSWNEYLDEKNQAPDVYIHSPKRYRITTREGDWIGYAEEEPRPIIIDMPE